MAAVIVRVDVLDESPNPELHIYSQDRAVRTHLRDQDLVRRLAGRTSAFFWAEVAGQSNQIESIQGEVSLADWEASRERKVE